MILPAHNSTLYRGLTSTLALLLLGAGVWIVHLQKELRAIENSVISDAHGQVYKSGTRSTMNSGSIESRRGRTPEVSDDMVVDSREGNVFSEIHDPELDQLVDEQIEADIALSEIKPELERLYLTLFKDLRLPETIQEEAFQQLLSVERKRQELLLSQEALSELQSQYDQTLQRNLSEEDYRSYRELEEGNATQHTINLIASRWDDHFQEPLSLEEETRLGKAFAQIGGSNLVPEAPGPYSAFSQIDHYLASSGTATSQRIIDDRLSLLHGDLDYLRSVLEDPVLYSEIESLYSAQISELEEASDAESSF